MVRSDEDVFNFIVSILTERGVTSGRVGTNLYFLYVSAERYIREKLPNVELVEMHPEIMKLRLNPDMEARALVRKSSEIADGAYAHALKHIKAGVTENKVRAEIDNYIYAAGGDDCFTGVAAGRYSNVPGKNKARFAWPPTAALNKIEPGDTVVLEITPRLDGYWSQIVRFVSVSEPNPELVEINDYIQKSIEFAVEGVQPGKTIGSMCRAVREKFAAYTNEYTIGHNIGHLCGLDLTDGNLLDDSEVMMVPGLALIIHPSVMRLDGTCELFGGDTFMVTETGCENLMKSDTKIHVV